MVWRPGAAGLALSPSSRLARLAGADRGAAYARLSGDCPMRVFSPSARLAGAGFWFGAIPPCVVQSRFHHRFLLRVWLPVWLMCSRGYGWPPGWGALCRLPFPFLCLVSAGLGPRSPPPCLCCRMRPPESLPGRMRFSSRGGLADPLAPCSRMCTPAGAGKNFFIF